MDRASDLGIQVVERRVPAVHFEHLIEPVWRCHGRAGVGAGRPGRRGPARPAGRCAARPDPRTRPDPQPARCRDRPQRPRRRDHPGARARRAEDDGLLAARARPPLARGRPACWSATAAPWPTCRRWPRPAPPGRSPPTSSRSSPRSPPRRTWPRPPPRASTWPCIDQALADVATGERYDRLAQVVDHYLSALDPDGPEPDPTEGRSLSITTHADGSRLRPLRPRRRSAGRRCETVLESIVQANRPAGGHAHPRPAVRRRVRAVGRQHPGRRARCPSCAPSSRTWSSPSPLDDLVDPATGPGAGAPIGLRRGHLRRPGPLAGLRRHRSPGSSSAPTAADGPRPHPAGRPAPPAPQRSSSATSTASSPAAEPRTTGATSITSCTGCDGGETIPGELRAALRTPPHQGPPRLPDRTRSRRPMAHLPPRRHRDPHLPAPLRT